VYYFTMYLLRSILNSWGENACGSGAPPQSHGSHRTVLSIATPGISAGRQKTHCFRTSKESIGEKIQPPPPPTPHIFEVIRCSPDSFWIQIAPTVPHNAIPEYCSGSLTELIVSAELPQRTRQATVAVTFWICISLSLSPSNNARTWSHSTVENVSPLACRCSVPKVHSENVSLASGGRRDFEVCFLV
jgi:hypothetical protein